MLEKHEDNDNRTDLSKSLSIRAKRSLIPGAANGVLAGILKTNEPVTHSIHEIIQDRVPDLVKAQSL